MDYETEKLAELQTEVYQLAESLRNWYAELKAIEIAVLAIAKNPQVAGSVRDDLMHMADALQSGSAKHEVHYLRRLADKVALKAGSQ